MSDETTLIAEGTPAPGRITRTDQPEQPVDNRLYHVAAIPIVDDEFYVWAPDFPSVVDAVIHRARLMGLPPLHREITERCAP
jgi:hypothetical protein